MYYEVVIGNDRWFLKIRLNIYYFENVGLNISYIFMGLNFIVKVVEYFIIVCVMSFVGSI